MPRAYLRPLSNGLLLSYVLVLWGCTQEPTQSLSPEHEVKVSESKVACPIAITEKGSIGSLRLGMDTKDMMKTSFPLQEVYRDQFEGDGLTVRLKDGRITSIAAQVSKLPDCLTFKGKPIPNSLSFEQGRKLFGPCESPAMRPATIGSSRIFYSRCGPFLRVDTESDIKKGPSPATIFLSEKNNDERG